MKPPVQSTPYDRESIRPEETLESWLHANPDIILDEPILIIGRQVRLDTGVADLLGCDQFGNVVVIEVKIGRSGTGSASEETILSQPQAYASSLSTFDYNALNDLYQDYRSRLKDDEWVIDETVAPHETLQSAIEAVFGKELTESEFNDEQRLVVVTEEITQRTAANVRYLLEQGLHFQCVEVQWFSSPQSNTDDGTVLASSVVVDYDLSRVRPTGRPSPTYPDLAAEILDQAFPEFQPFVEADALSEVLPDGLDTREHRLVSNNPDHPESAVYRLGVKPDNHTVRIGIDVKGDEKWINQQIRGEKERFVENGFTVSGNETYRVVVTEWDLDEPGDVQDVIDEVADQYARLVQLGHDILVD